MKHWQVGSILLLSLAVILGAGYLGLSRIRNERAGPEAAQLELATLDYEEAVANFNLVSEGATEAEIARFRAQVEQAAAEVAADLSRQTFNELEVASLELEVERARLVLARLQAGLDPQFVNEVVLAEENRAVTARGGPIGACL